ncbi:MAG: division/cell wall cluster transcriptional repressor MraZ [Christensenellaceae bacterium]|jgi:MraZ protein
MLIGEYSHNLDAKGRIFMPAKFREELGQNFIVTRGIGKCLFVFAPEVWEAFTEKLRDLPITNKDAQTFLRLLFAYASECEPDKQGRILLPARLREYGEMEKEVTAIGVMSRVELWANHNWAAYNEQANDEYEETLEKLAELGI